MNKTYHYEIVRNNGTIYQSREFGTIEECVDACKNSCDDFGVEYSNSDVRLFLTDDFGETYEECTEEGELAG